ncbi:hypothetical protein D320_03001 [Haloferax sp. BAB-2207]|nr:hypothetical protein D320_03001 [Haloferax sp. BAB-2207]WEL27239.1 hypothetical protein SVXHx_3030 [Haloferax lucentense]
MTDRETPPKRGYRADIGGLSRLVDPNDFRLARQMRIPTATNGVYRVSNASRVRGRERLLEHGFSYRK